VVETATQAPELAAQPCAGCGHALVADQDWCLECGTPRPGRLGARPGWRPALTVVALTGTLALGAAAASWAALSSEAQRTVAAPPPPAAAPLVAQPPATPAPPAPVPEVEAPAVTPPADSGADFEPAPTPDVDAPDPTPAPAPAPTRAPSGDTGADTGTGGDGGDDRRSADAEPQPIELAEASALDPYARGGQALGDPADAIDGDPATAWEAPVAQDGSVRIGIVVSLERAARVREAVLTADTPGFDVETYATTSSEIPPDPLDARWRHFEDENDVGVEETLEIGGTSRFRHVLLWITQQPADTTVRIAEVELRSPAT